MSISRIPLGELSPQVFLEQYWQKRPLLVRQAFPGFRSPLTPDELAGLACEPEVESRLVMEKGGKQPWQVRHGPFREKDFAKLPETHWTLLVQAVDRHVPEVEDLLEYFRFLPSWRIDDIMISYAPPHGSVGPHTDSYDVFLLQIWGHRRWEISRRYAPGLLPDVDLKILAQFEAEESWVLEPGDMLYLPPQVAHHGVAVDDCMTLSVGFLAPSHTELLGHYVDHVLLGMDPDLRYADPDLALQDEPGELDPRSLRKVRDIVRGLPLDDARIDHWFAAYISEAQRGPAPGPLEEPYSTEEWLEEFHIAGHLRRNARMVFIRDGRRATLYANGQAFALDEALAFAAPLLSGEREFAYAQLQAHLSDSAFVDLLVTLTNQGLLYFYGEEEI